MADGVLATLVCIEILYYAHQLLTFAFIIYIPYNNNTHKKMLKPLLPLLSLLFLLFPLLPCLHIDPPSYKISSTLQSTHFQIIIQLSQDLEHESLSLHTQGFSQQHNNHVLKLKQDGVIIEPHMKSEDIVFNYKEGNRYLVALVHQVGGRDVNFMPVDVSYRGAKNQYLLAAFDSKISQIPIESLYCCHKTLLSIQQSNEDDVDYHLYLFTTDKEEGTWITQNEFYSWRHYFNNVYFGQIRIKKSSMPYRLQLTESRYCMIDAVGLSQKLREAKEKGQYIGGTQLEKKKYYKVKQLLQQVPKLEVFRKKVETTTMQEL